MERDAVMIIDDDPEYRELLGFCIRDWGLECFEAGNCRTALPILERERHRLRAVLLDYFMPGTAPVRCAGEVRARVGPQVEVVLVSAAVDIAGRAEELGLKRYLAKPFDLSQLARVLGVEPEGRRPGAG